MVVKLLHYITVHKKVRQEKKIRNQARFQNLRSTAEFQPHELLIMVTIPHPLSPLCTSHVCPLHATTLDPCYLAGTFVLSEKH